MTAIKQTPLYTNVYHDRRSDDIYVWYEDGSQKKYRTTHRFYTPHRGEYESTECGMKDIYGNPVYVAHRNHFDERNILNSHRGDDNHLSEIDIEYRTRWLQQQYAGQDELRFDINNFNTCFLDIEIQTELKFPTAEEAAYPINVITLYMTRQNRYYTFGLGQDISEACQNRMLSLNKYLFSKDVFLESDSVNVKRLMDGLKNSQVFKDFNWPKEREVPAADLVKIFNGILCSNVNRDKFFSRNINGNISEELSSYLVKFTSYERDKCMLDGRLRLLRKQIKLAPISEKKSVRDDYATKRAAFEKWVSDKEASLKEERLQKRLVREYMEMNLPVIKGIYPPDADFKYYKCETESKLIEYTFRCLGQSNIDFISGWNTAGFDLPYMFNRAKKMNIPARYMSRVGDQNREIQRATISADMKKFKNKHNYYDVNIAGTSCWDYLMLYKLYSRSERDNMKLDTIGKEEVGDEKKPLSNGFQTYRTNWDEYVEYNVQDVNLLVKLDEAMRLIETSVSVCSQARIPYDGLFETKKIMVGFLVNYLHERGMVMPPLRTHEDNKYPGAFVFSKPGHYKHLVSYDYRAMYPSIDMAGNISLEKKVKFPDGYIPTPDELKDLVISPVDGIYFKKDSEGIIPSVMKHLFDGRVLIKADMKRAMVEGRITDASYFDMKQYAYKIYANSLYGLLGLKYFQFYDRDCAHSITALGVDLIKYTCLEVSKYFDTELIKDSRFVEAFGEKPTLDPNMKGFDRFSHGDTDSFFVIYDDLYTPFKDKYTLTEFSRIMDAAIFDKLLVDTLQKFSDKWNCMSNTFYMKREKCIPGALVLARKKYMCSVESNEDVIYPELKSMTTGMEIVRSSTAPFSRSRLKTIAWSMVNDLDKQKIRTMYAAAKVDFFKHVDDNDILPISIPSGIGKTPPPIDIVMTTKGHHYLSYAGAVWNDVIVSDPDLSQQLLEPIFEGSKIKILKVSPYNKWRTKYIAYTGADCPDKILDIFDVEWEVQFDKIFANTTQKFFECVGWPKNIENDVSDIMDMFD